MHRFRKIVVLFTVIMLAGCNTSQNPPQDDNISPDPVGYSEAQSENDGPDEHHNVKRLAGGPEAKVREPHPVSNSLLQREYPNTVVIHGPRTSNEIAITFDDGPSTRFTPKILDVLDKYNAKATFFVLGARAKALPDIVKRIHREGHAIGNHTYWHPNLAEEGVATLDWSATQTNKVIEDILGFKTRLFRPPYGSLNEKLVKHLKDMRLNAVVWSVDSLNWKEVGTQRIVDIVLNNVQPGDIILFHDAGNWTQDLSGTIKALDIIIPKLQKDGMKLVTVPELLNIPEKK